MDSKWCSRTMQATMIALVLAAICQELEKPEAEREWHGKVAGFVPYDFRMPTREKLKEAYWNPMERRVFTPEVFGVGWAINFYRLLENMGVIRQDVSEESFLMPTKSIKEVLEQTQPAD